VLASAKFSILGLGSWEDSPFFSHHENTLDQDSFQNLGTDALEESQHAFVLDDELHHLAKALEGLALPGWWGVRLQADLGDDEWLSGNGC
jgi:hypothetical protein